MKLIYCSCVRNDFHRQRNVGGFIAHRITIIATPVMAQDVGESAAEVRASRQSSCKPQGQSRSVELAQRMAHSGRPSRRRPAEHSKLAALFALVVLSVTPASADDLIEQWLKKDEASAQIVEARPDLNAPRMSSGTKSSSLGASKPNRSSMRAKHRRAFSHSGWQPWLSRGS